MKLNIIHRNCPPTDGIDQAIRDRAEKIARRVDDECEISWTCHVEPEFQESSVMVHFGHHYFFAKERNDNFYKTLDKAYKKIDRQIDEYQKKHKKILTH